MLAKLNVITPTDLEIRRIGDKQLLHGYFSGYNTAENSDFFPILDLRGARDRFLGRNAQGISELAAYPIPVVDMLGARTPGRVTPGIYRDEGGKAARLKDALLARQMAEFVADGNLAGKTELNSQLVTELVHVRDYWLKCDKANAANARLDPLLRFAQFVNPGMPPDELRSIWAAFTESRCYQAQSAYQRLWVALFAAVGQRDAQTMVNTVLAVFPMQVALPVPAWSTAATAGYPYEIEYLHVALVTALLAQGKREDAKRAWQAVLEIKSERFKRTPMALLLEATVNVDQAVK